MIAFDVREFSHSLFRAKAEAKPGEAADLARKAQTLLGGPNCADHSGVCRGIFHCNPDGLGTHL